MKSRILNPHNVGLCCSTRWTVLFHTLDCVVPHVGLCCSTRCGAMLTHVLAKLDPAWPPVRLFLSVWAKRRRSDTTYETSVDSSDDDAPGDLAKRVWAAPPPVWNRGFYYYFNSVTWKPPPHSCFCSGKRNRILFRNRIAGPLLFARSPWKAQSWREVVIKKKVISAKDIISHTIKGHPPCVIDREKEGLPTISVTHLQPHPNPPSAS